MATGVGGLSRPRNRKRRKQRFQLKDGAKLPKKNAQVIGERLEVIRLSHRGRLNEEDVVEDARDRRALLHRYFEWDDSKAAYEHRLEQARALIRAVIILMPTGDASRYYQSIKVEDRAVYMPTTEILETPGYREQLIKNARFEMQSFVERYEQLKRLASVIKVMRRTISKIRGR